jgi:hypothetical protein
VVETEKDKSDLQQRSTSHAEAGEAPQNPPSVSSTEPGVEPDDPPSKGILVLLAGLTLFLVIVGVGLWQIFGLTSIAEIEVKDLQVDNQELLELRARDWGRLTQYEVLDGGTYQIPIERAMKKLVHDPSLIAPLVSPSVEDAGAQNEGGISDAESPAAATQKDGEASKETHAPLAPASAPAASAPSPVSSEIRP